MQYKAFKLHCYLKSLQWLDTRKFVEKLHGNTFSSHPNHMPLRYPCPIHLQHCLRLPGYYRIPHYHACHHLIEARRCMPALSQRIITVVELPSQLQSQTVFVMHRNKCLHLRVSIKNVLQVATQNRCTNFGRDRGTEQPTSDIQTKEAFLFWIFDAQV